MILKRTHCLIAFLLVIIIVSVIALLPVIAGKAINHALAQLGYINSNIKVDSLNLENLILRSLTAQDSSNVNQIQLSKVVISYNTEDLYNGIIDSINIGSLGFHFSINNSKLSDDERRQRSLGALNLPHVLINIFPVKYFSANNIYLGFTNDGREIGFKGEVNFDGKTMHGTFVEIIPVIQKHKWTPLTISSSLHEDNSFEILLTLPDKKETVFSYEVKGKIQLKEDVVIQGHMNSYLKSHASILQRTSLLEFFDVMRQDSHIENISINADFIYTDNNQTLTLSEGKNTFKYNGEKSSFELRSQDVEISHNNDTNIIEFKTFSTGEYRRNNEQDIIRLSQVATGTYDLDEHSLDTVLKGLVTLVQSESQLSLLPFNNEATLHYSDHALDFSGVFNDLNKSINLTVTGRHNYKLDHGNATIKLAPVTFTKYYGIEKLIQNWIYPVEIHEGNVEGVALLGWNEIDLTSTITATFDNMNIVFMNELYGESSVDGLSSSIKFTIENDYLMDISPVHVTVEELTLDILTLSNVYVNLELGQRSELIDFPPVKLNRLEASLLDGLLYIDHTNFDAVNGQAEFVMYLEGLSLRETLSLYGDKSLTGSGKINGKLPMTVKNQEITIKDGHIGATTPGTIRYAPSQVSMTISNTSMQTGMLLASLDDYHYTKLESSIDYDPSGLLKLGIELQGSNPQTSYFSAQGIDIELPAHQEIRLNPNIDFNLLDLLVSMEHNDYQYMSNRMGSKLVNKIERQLEHKELDKN